VGCDQLAGAGRARGLRHDETVARGGGLHPRLPSSNIASP
jgi:hypothetical protein